MDVCKAHNDTNPILALMIKMYTEHSSTIGSGCPLNGENNWLNWELNEHVSEILPPIIPEGDFRLLQRGFNSKNRTFITIKYGLLVKGTGLMKMSMLNMGK